MKSAEFNEMIASSLTRPVKTITVYARLLKEAGMLTTGGRGRYAPDMTPMDAARMVIANLTTDSPSQCVERVQRFGKIKYSPGFRKTIRGYETIQPELFETMLEGETLEEVLAYIFSLPTVMGIEESCKWYAENEFHLRVYDFEVLAELFMDQWANGEIVGVKVVPFKGKTMERTSDGFRPVKGYTPIKGGVRTERLIASPSFLQIGLILTPNEQFETGN
ncbi:MAG: hypothetical protein HRU33_06595 [Rhodobacteraceae bacterium]|nr:hypothetical protein [Paracoccaceae bacterium]